MSGQALNLRSSCSVPGIAGLWHQIQPAHWILTWSMLAPLLHFCPLKEIIWCSSPWLWMTSYRQVLFFYISLCYFAVPLILHHREKVYDSNSSLPKDQVNVLKLSTVMIRIGLLDSETSFVSQLFTSPSNSPMINRDDGCYHLPKGRKRSSQTG